MSRKDWRMTERGDGLDAWINELSDMARPSSDLRDRLDHVTNEFTEALRATMPVRSGRLKSSGYWTSRMTGDIYEATVQFGGEVAPYAPYVIGRHVNGEHAWDAVLPAFEPRYEAVFREEFDR